MVPPIPPPRPTPGFPARLRTAAARLRREIAALWIAARDPRTPRAARLLAALVVACALSPIDLIPDPIPILGQLDDLILIPLGIWLTLRLIPPTLMAEFRAEAASRTRPHQSRLGLLIVLATWTALALILARLLI